MNDKIKMRNKFIFSINPKNYVYLYKEKLSKAFLYVLVLALIIGVIQGAMSAIVISGLEKTTKMILNQDEVQFEMKNGILDFKASPIKEEEGQALLISLVGLLSNLIGNRKISYRELFNLSLYAVTLPAIINLIYPIGGYFILVGGIILMFGLSYIFLNNEKQNIESN